MSVNRHVVRKTNNETNYVYVRDLETNKDDPDACLVCPICYGEWSANPSDYFWKSEDEPFVCDNCDAAPLSLVIRVTEFVVLAGEAL